MTGADSTAEKKATKLTFAVLRLLAESNQKQFGDASGVGQSRISRYETGKARPRKATIERLLAPAGVSRERLEQLRALLRLIVEESEANRSRVTSSKPNATAALNESLRERLAVVETGFDRRLAVALQEFTAQVEATSRPATPEEARTRAREVWREVAELPCRHRRLVVQNCREFQQWAVCEFLCAESQQAQPEEGVELAELAVLVAESTPGEGGAKDRLLGYAWGFLASARRAAGEPEEAEDALLRARSFWGQGEPSAFEPLREDLWLEVIACFDDSPPA